MSIRDYDSIFDQIDISCHGYLTVNQLHDFHKSLYFSSIPLSQINSAVTQICGVASGGKVSRELFIIVLLEIERQRTLQEQCYWDFRALDTNGDDKIMLRDAFILFQEFHGEKFSLDTWKRFLSCREYPNCDVYYDEIKSWLSEIPDGPPCTDEEFLAEEKRLKELTEESKWQEYVSWNSFQEDNAYDEDYRNDINREAQRKLNKWTRQGVEAMLYDDGLDLAMNPGNQPLKPRNSINMSDLMDALDQKYNILQDRLLLHMAEVSSNMESEVTEIFQSLRKHTKQLLKDKNLSDNSSDLPGANAVLPYTLAAVMGHHKSDRNFELIEANIFQLKKDGKTEKEINEFYENQFEDLNNGSKTCGDILVQLNERHEQERDYCLSILHGGQDRKTTTNLLNTELASLSHQHSLLGYESAINQSAFSSGLGERGGNDELQGLDAVRWRKLAQLRLDDKKGRKQTRVTDSNLTLIKTDDLGTIDLRLKVIEEIDRKHFFEREALINMLEGPESSQWLAEMRNLATNEQDSRITKYRNQQKNWMNNLSSVQPDPQTLNNHQNILQQAVAIHWCHTQVTMEISQPNIADDQISAAILSELQKFQETEIKEKIEEIQSLGVSELKKLIKTEYCLCINECFEGIASIALGSLKVSDEEKEYLDAVDEKYSAIRDKLFLYLLQQQHGLNWINLPVDVKQKEIVRMRREEKKIRSTGQTDDFIQFLGTKAMALPSLNSLLGPQKWKNADNVVNNSSTDILSDLIGRYDAEQQALLNWLQSSEVKNYPNRKKRKEIVYARLQTRTISLETDLEAAYIATGLLERLEDRDKEDKTRVARLCELNVKLWRERKEEGKRYKKLYPDFQKQQKQGDITESQLYCLMEVKHRHGDEREQLLQLVNEVSSEDLQEAAAMMGEGDRQKRLSELQTKYQSLDLTNADDINEYRSIVEEAGAIQVICRKAMLQKERKRGVTPDMTAASLLENLYRQQDKDLMSLYVNIDKMEEEELRALQLKERENRKKDISMNVMKVLTMVEGAAHEHDILQIIDRKYDVLKDRVLLESIKQSHDTAAWSKINNHDKQKLVDRLKESTEKSWRQGNIEEFAASVGLQFKLSFDLKNVLGADRETFNKTGKIDVFKEEFTENGVLCLDVIKFLWNRFETEKEYIINISRGTSGAFISDNEKFVLISRLTREMTVCNNESSVYLSGLLVGLLERQVNDVQNLSDLDLPRYKVLAAETVTWCKSKKDDIKITNGLKSTDKITLQNDVLLLLHNQHLQERLDWFKMLTNVKQVEISKMASVKSQQQRNDRLIALKNAHATLNPVAVDENLDVLLEAMVYKLENLKSLSEYENYTEEMIQVLMMAFLLQHQLVQAENILQHFPEQSSEDLTWLANQLTSDQHNKRCNNVATIVFSTYAIRESTQDELLTALEGKYDALRDKLIVEALINQYGELDWSKITDEERQKKILELKIKERRLRRDGKLGDVNKLIGESLKNQDALAKLMGDNKAEQERKLKERLERRKQRKEEGKTEEECNNMEEEDRKKEEEEEKKNTNIILELENRFDQEKEQLMKQLLESGDKDERERQRQAQLIKLRQEERKARKEEGFESAALVLGLAQMDNEKVQENLEEEKERQWRLAKERLMAARKRKRKTESKQPEEILDEDIENIDNKTRLKEILLMVADRNHGSDRDLIINLLEEVDGDVIATLKSQTDESLENKISESCELRSNWKESANQNPEDQRSIFKEVSGYTVEVKGREKGQYYDLDEVKVELLADLQHLQDIESRKLRLQIPQKDIPWLKTKINEVKGTNNHDNVAVILFLGQGATVDNSNQDERAVIAALEKKYDVMKDKLIVEALMKEMGQADWNRLSQLDRQRKVIQIKLRSRKLKKEGKMDAEVSALIGKHLQDAKAVNTLLGESKIEQQRRLEEKLARRRLLKIEREATVLEREDSNLEEKQKIEEKKEMKKNILDNLEKQLESDKERLLKSLRNKTSKLEKAKARWKLLAKLQREAKLLKAEDNIDSAVLVFNMGNQNNLMKEKSFIEERVRQRELAKDRLKHKHEEKKKMLEDNQTDLIKQLEKNLMTSPALVPQDVKDELMENLDRHHHYERDILLHLLKSLEDNTDLTNKATQQTEDELKHKLTELQKNQSQIQTDAQFIALSVNLKLMDQSDQQTYLVGVAKRRTEQYRIMREAASYRMEVELRLMQESRQDTPLEDLRKELAVTLLADLQERQESESKILRNLIVEKSDDVLENICNVQKVAEREGWYKNLSIVLFTLTSSTDDLDLLPDITMETQKLEDKFEREKQEITEIAVSLNEDPSPKLDELEENYKLKKEEMMKNYDSQRTEIKRKLAAKRLLREATKIRTLEASQLMEMAETHAKAKKSGWATLRRKTSLLQDRLTAKREEKQKAEEIETENRRRGSLASGRSKSVERSLLLNRDKTAVDVAVTPDQKQAMFSQLVRQQRSLHTKINEQQHQQEEMLKRRLESRRHGRQEQATALLNLSERQKTALDQANEEEKEGQKNVLREHLERAKNKNKATTRSKSAGRTDVDDIGGNSTGN